jgi:hypothetical protein
MSKRRLSVKMYEIVSRAVEEGVALGVNRAHKYTDTPTREGIAEEVERAVMESLSDVIDFRKEG